MLSAQFPLKLLFIFVFGDVPWLNNIQQPVDPEVEPKRVLEPLLPIDNAAKRVPLDAWLQQRHVISQKWQEFLGPSPVRPADCQFEVLNIELLPKYSRKLIRYEDEPGEHVEAYLLEPTTPTLVRPGVLAFHATTDETNGPISGIGGRDDEQIGRKLAERGFVVLCPKNFLWHNVTSYEQAVLRFQSRFPESLGMRKMLFDAMRATDILAALPDVDPQRIGAVGHSLGAKEVLYLAAFDDRISAAVFSEGGLDLDSTNWDAPWYLGDQIHRNFTRNHHELVALIAPRPFLVLGGESGPGAADGTRSWPYIKAALPIYQLYGEPSRIGLVNHREGHSVSATSYEKIEEWLSTYLQIDRQ